MKLPESFSAVTIPLLGELGFQQLSAALSEEQPVSIRLNTRFKPSVINLQISPILPVPWTTQGYYLQNRPTFTFDPLFHAGCYYVQEASSMFIEQVLKSYVSHPVVMLDLCAAPGGKSTHLLSLLPEGSLLVANEVMRNRSQILAENVAKWGCPDVVVTNNDPADFSPLGQVFDVMLTDVPCSGEGMFRKDPVAVSEWSPENVELCWQRQRRILSDIWGNLKPGGLLIYSTCTYNTKENEENVAWICRELGAEVLPLDISDTWRITGNLSGDDFPVYRFLPHLTRGEGFFMAVLRKHDTDQNRMEYLWKSEKTSKNKKEKTVVCSFPKETLALAKKWVKYADSYEWCITNTSLVLFPRRYLLLYQLLKQHLRVLLAGVEVACLKGKDLVPQQALALSCLLQRSAFVCAEVTDEQAIAYLRKEAITLSVDTPRGYVLLTYQHVPLGFVKNIGNRANNLYPSEWRIRSSYLPEQLIKVFK
ncbi:tRNA/rRNA methyltransferase [gut metagenome]|uniref:tRNA/rRNA methyltransferase n=1 Tax=gut metagenome TaxID=749906 RepID=J9BZB6_9ZZZZ